jgi:hypothetical protein
MARFGDVSFFKGTTADGVRWVFSYEGGPSACRPDDECFVSGMIGSRKIRRLNIAVASELRAILPYINESDVIWEMARLQDAHARRARMVA